MKEILLVGFNNNFYERLSTVLGNENSIIHSRQPQQYKHYAAVAVGELKRLPPLELSAKYLLCAAGYIPPETMVAEYIIHCGMGEDCTFTLSSVGGFDLDDHNSNNSILSVKEGINNTLFSQRNDVKTSRESDTEFAREILFDSHKGMGLYDNIIIEALKFLILCSN